jgi:hypothetical protein
VEELQVFFKRGLKFAFGLAAIVINHWLESMYNLANMLAKKAIIFARMYRKITWTAYRSFSDSVSV